MVLHACPIYESGSTFLLPQWRSPNLKVGLSVWWSNTGKTPWNTFQGLPHSRFPTVYLQVVKLPKETYATDIHWFPPGVSSKKTSNQSDLFVLACTDGQSAVLRVLWLVWEITWLVWEIMWLVWGVMWLVWGHVTCMRSHDLYEVMWLVWGHVTCMRGHVTCIRSCDLYGKSCDLYERQCVVLCPHPMHNYFCLQKSHISIVATFSLTI